MRSAGRRAAIAAALAGCLCARAAGAMELLPTIDLNYDYEQRNLAGAVHATTHYQQIYQLKLATRLTSALDFQGTVKLDLDDKWSTKEATTSRIAPTLELGVKGAQLASTFSYAGTVTSTDQFREQSDSEKYSNSADLSLELTPEFWPEVRLNLQKKRDYQLQTDDATSRLMELQLRDELYGLQLEFLLKLAETDTLLPERARNESIDWSLKSTYKRELFGGTEFEVTHEISESLGENSRREVFTTVDETYSQRLQSRLRNSLELTPLLKLGLAWEYVFEQDLLQLEYDYKVQNKYALDLRYDMFPRLKFSATAKRDASMTAPVVGEEEVRDVADLIGGGFDFVPVEWLRFNGKAELNAKAAIAAGSGGSVDRTTERNYELGLKNKFGAFWDLSVNGSYRESDLDGRPDSQESKLKAALKLSRWDLSVAPTYEASRKADWDDVGALSMQSSVSDFRVKIDYQRKVLDLLAATFSHEYGIKVTWELDEVLNLERELQMNEDTRLNLSLVDLIEGLRVEGEVQRKGTDIEDDKDPQLVEISYSLKLDWQYRELTLGGSLLYSDKGENFDDLIVTTKVAWKVQQLGLSGEYTFGKIYAEETDENRKLALKLTYTF